jgi:hypothetical protein
MGDISAPAAGYLWYMYFHNNQQHRFQNMLADLQGQIERITYTNEENGYTIAKVKVYGRRDLVTVVGNFMAPMPGKVLKMQGEGLIIQNLVSNSRWSVTSPWCRPQWLVLKNIWGPGLSRASGLSWPSGSSRNSESAIRICGRG